jgi:hypothetical protein
MCSVPVADLLDLLNYLWDDEEEDWEALEPAERDNHIFNTVRRLNDCLPKD